ncbi:hypothetical protein B0H66DRAFT_632104 [Apodospora peruviana]|uniref:Uncharacterized protein n=1 Tax=Apodospora peruviana TaxID=516989 RepID=A0AAE0LZ52_9PEZI|nr:hypothetical protein B0H66DRAFT_632104 [Apodospora peruviana]
METTSFKDHGHDCHGATALTVDRVSEAAAVEKRVRPRVLRLFSSRRRNCCSRAQAVHEPRRSAQLVMDEETHGPVISLPGCLLTDGTLTWGTTVFELQSPECVMAGFPSSSGPSFCPWHSQSAPPSRQTTRLLPHANPPELLWSASTSHWHEHSTQITLCSKHAPSLLTQSYTRSTTCSLFHERTRKTNICASSFLIGPYICPMISSLLLLKMGWRPDFGVLAGFYASSLLVVIVLGGDTLFDREGLELLDGHHQVVAGTTKRPFSLTRHMSLLVGIEGFRTRAGRPGLWTVFSHQCFILVRHYVFLPAALFVMAITMWTIGMATTISQFVLPPPSRGAGDDLLIGTLVAEGWGHFFNDFLARKHMARYGFESRLTAVYPAVLVGVIGLVVIEQTLVHHLHWTALAFGWAMLCFCTFANMTAISAYLLDCLPQHAALTGAWLTFWRVIGGFSVIYFQI